MGKDNTILLIGIGAVLLFLGFFTGFIPSIGALITGQVSFCAQTPFDGKCVCPLGQEKYDTGYTWACRIPIEPPSNYSFPLTDYSQGYAYVKDQIGVSCTSPYFIQGPPQSGAIPSDFSILNIECDKPLPEQNTFAVAWRLQFFTVTGNIMVKSCSQTLVNEMNLGEQCPVGG